VARIRALLESLKAIQKAFHEAMLALPREEYDWFDVHGRARQDGGAANAAAGGLPAGTHWQEELPGVAEPVFATRNRALQLRYLVRLYVKELVLKNFAGLPADQLLERMIELSLYAEEKLKSG
jgi:hypothetical protein